MEVMEKYQNRMEELKGEVDKLENRYNEGSLSANDYEEKTQGIKQQAQAEQQDYIERYKQSLSDEMDQVREKVASSELPASIASLDNLKGVSNTELQILADKHKDNYFAQKKISEVAKDKQMLNVETYGFNVKERLRELEQQRKNAHRNFNTSNPLKDTQSSKLKGAFGLE